MSNGGFDNIHQKLLSALGARRAHKLEMLFWRTRKMDAPIQLDSPKDIPLFPLRVVMFPGSRLDLQIFDSAT